MSKKTPPDIEQKVIEMYVTPAQDGTWTGGKTIARVLGITDTTVQNILIRNGIGLRNAREAHALGKRCKPVKNIPAGIAPLCKCGCGKSVAWNRRKNRWNAYVAGHYRKDAPYKSKGWLEREYVSKQRMLRDIANECGVSISTVINFLVKFGIPMRTQGQSLAVSGAVRGSRNAAWKGGIAKWEYAPNWKRIAHDIRKRDNYTCQICFTQFPKSSKLLHVHHKDGNKFHNDDSNLVTVCASCHPKGKRKEGWSSTP